MIGLSLSSEAPRDRARGVPFQWPEVAALTLLGLISMIVIVVLGTRLTFFNDDWWFLLQRPGLESYGGLDVLLAPHNSNAVVLPAAIYKVMVAVFGLSSQIPYRIVLAVSIAAVGIMVFLLVAERAGKLAALASAGVILFLGAAWEDLLFFASIDLIGSLAVGLAALWVLDRVEPRTILGCLLLVCSIAFSNVGVPFVLGAVVALLLRRRHRQLWVPALPLGLFGIWWFTYGNSEPSNLSAHNIEHLPKYVLDSVSAGLASMAGLPEGTAGGTLVLGRALFGVIAVLIVVAVARGWRPSAFVLVPLVTALVFWCLTGASYVPGRDPWASRYQLIDVALLLVIGSELVGPFRPGRLGSAAFALVAIAVIASNTADGLARGYRFMADQSGFVKAELGALELGRRLAPNDLWLLPAVAHNLFLSGVTAGPFFAETAAHGRVPTYTPRQIAAASSAQRQGADSVLAVAERIIPTNSPTPLGRTSGCSQITPGVGGESPELSLSLGKWLLAERGGRGLVIAVRRFAPPALSSNIGLIRPGLVEQMTIPPDSVSVPWRLSVKAPSAVTAVRLVVCPAPHAT